MTWKRAGIILTVAGAAVVAGGLAGCQSSPWDVPSEEKRGFFDNLFSSDATPPPVRRSQYDDYHRIRGDYRDDHTKNRFGGQEVNLRERLKPLDDGAM